MRTMISKLVLVGSALAALNCGGEPDATEDEIKAKSGPARSNVVGEVEAVRVRWQELDMKRIAVFGAPKKITSALTTLGLSAGQKMPKEGAYKCPPIYQIELLDADLQVLAAGGFCGDTEGYINVPEQEKNFLLKGSREPIDKLAEQAPLLGDVFYGARSLEVRRHGDGSARVEDISAVAKLMLALDENAKLTADPAIPKCLPTYSVSVERSSGADDPADSEVAGTFNMHCGVGEATGKTTIYLTDEAERSYSASVDAGKVAPLLDKAIANGGEDTTDP